MKKQLFLYSDLHGSYGWYPNAAAFRADYPGRLVVVRAANLGVPAPAGYHKTGRGLANDPAERDGGYRDLVRAI